MACGTLGSRDAGRVCHLQMGFGVADGGLGMIFSEGTGSGKGRGFMLKGEASVVVNAPGHGSSGYGKYREY